MKRWILTIAGLGTLTALGLYVNSAKISPLAPAETIGASTPEPAVDTPPAVATIAKTPAPFSKHAAPVSRQAAASSNPWPAPPAPAITPSAELDFEQTLETLLSPRASYKYKQAAWKQLKDTNDLNHAISELERRVADDPQTADYAAALGQAYWKKCALLDDVREQAILAMKADQLFETALQLDPANWEARFTKAVAMSRWPAELNKGQEVIDQFQTLIQQQETQSPQPQFAKTYLRLGDQYQKAGYPDYATQVWQRGASLFPDNTDLQEKLTPAR